MATFLCSIDPPMVEGGHLMTSAMGSPLVSAISNSLQGGLFQAASAAFVSALSSMGATPVVAATPTVINANITSQQTTSSQSTTTTASTQNLSAPTPPPPPPRPAAMQSSANTTTTTTTTPSSQPTSTALPNHSTPQPREGPPTLGNPPSGVRGITVRITSKDFCVKSTLT